MLCRLDILRFRRWVQWIVLPSQCWAYVQAHLVRRDNFEGGSVEARKAPLLLVVTEEGCVCIPSYAVHFIHVCDLYINYYQNLSICRAD